MANSKQPDKDQLVRVAPVPAQVTPPPNQSSILRAALAVSQQTETDSLGQLYKGTPLPVIRHAPFNATANPVVNAAANSAAQNTVKEALTVLTLPFDKITSGDNGQADMTVDAGATLIPVNGGLVGANDLYNQTGVLITPISGTPPSHPGEILISQPDGSAAFADPLVQGLYAAGSSIASPPVFTPPTTIQPVLIGAADPTGLLQNLNVDATGALICDATLDDLTKWGGALLGAATAWGTPSSGNVISTNSQIFAGSSPLTATGTSLNVNQTNNLYTDKTAESAGAFTGTVQFVFDGAQVEAQRTVSVCNTFQGQGGTPSSDPIWTPASGKKFRLMKLYLTVSGNATTSGAGLMTITFTDGPAGPLVGPTLDIYIPPPMPTLAGGVFAGTIFDTGMLDMGNGFPSATINNTLYMHASLLLGTGYVRVNTFGTEE